MMRFWTSLFVDLLLCTIGKNGHTFFTQNRNCPMFKPFLYFPTTAAVGQKKMSLSETGKDAYLSCGNVKGCDQIQWWFIASQDSVRVRIPPPQPGSTFTNRQICWRDCTLAVLRVQEKDAGLYICTRQTKELVQVDLVVLTGRQHLQLMDAEEQCSFLLLRLIKFCLQVQLEVGTTNPRISLEAKNYRAKLLLFYSHDLFETHFNIGRANILFFKSLKSSITQQFCLQQ